MVTLILRVAAWIAAGLVAALFLRWRLSSRRRGRIANLAIAYIVLLGVFGHLYQYLYDVDHSRFVFASEILSTRRLEIAAANAEEADKLKKLITAVTQLSDELTSGHAVIHLPRSDDTLVEVQTTDYHYDFNFDATWSVVNQGRLFRAARLVIRDKSGHNVGSDYVVANGPDISLQKKLAPKQWDALTDSYFPPKTTDKLLGMVGPLRFRLERSSNNEAESKTDSGLHPEQWTYLDFFYFSTITQTTVGYGDILPNRSSVRMCVVIQVLLGLLLLGVAISWVTSGEDAATSQP
jgi:hypothetical protein